MYFCKAINLFNETICTRKKIDFYNKFVKRSRSTDYLITISLSGKG